MNAPFDVLSKSGRVLGHVVHRTGPPDGFRFIPVRTGKGSSRKNWPTPEGCIPAWAKAERDND